jgi:hypothetical protein
MRELLVWPSDLGLPSGGLANDWLRRGLLDLAKNEPPVEGKRIQHEIETFTILVGKHRTHVQPETFLVLPVSVFTG